VVGALSDWLTSTFAADKALGSSPEFHRIDRVPRRTWTAQEGEDLRVRMTSVLRTPGGSQELRLPQAIALAEIGTQGAGFFPLKVGAGKTLISLLAAYVLGAKRPLLLMPAALLARTQREMGPLMKEWLIPRSIRPMSYQFLSQEANANVLEFWRPDLIICDEAHKLKNRRAACTRRVKKFLEKYPETRFVVLSGTMQKHGVKDYAHLLRWSMKQNATLPANEGELEQWAEILDEGVQFRRMRPGVLLNWCTDEDHAKAKGDETRSARLGFQRRLLETPGVFATPGEEVAASLIVGAIRYQANPSTEANFGKLRKEWTTPDGWTLALAPHVWAKARELALGFHHIWDPRPPEKWLNARKAWAKYVRSILADSRHLDSELQVWNAVRRGELGDPDGEALQAAWAAIKDTFTPHVKAVWHDDTALKVAHRWIEDGPGIVWVEHVLFGERLASLTGCDYYGSQGVNSKGRPIEDERGDRPVIASIQANGTGRNLQRFARNLITSLPQGADILEQLIGRTHRDGQTADEVTVDFLVGCAEHLEGFWKARADAEMARDTMGQPQKLLLADIDVPSVDEMRLWPGARWTRTAQAAGAEGITNMMLLAALENIRG
jgi:hypothetical protein